MAILLESASRLMAEDGRPAMLESDGYDALDSGAETEGPTSRGFPASDVGVLAETPSSSAALPTTDTATLADVVIAFDRVFLTTDAFNLAETVRSLDRAFLAVEIFTGTDVVVVLVKQSGVLGQLKARHRKVAVLVGADS